MNEPHRRPRWVTISAVVAVALVAALAVLLLTGRGEHSPGRHDPVSDGGQPQP